MKECFSENNSSSAEFVKNLLPVSPNLTIVEFGGSVGVVASHAVKRNPKGLVVIEADRELLDLCRINVNLNNVEDVDVVFLNFAVDYSDAAVTRFIPGATTTSGQLERTDQCRGLPMETTTLSQILESQHIDEYVLISDIEGAEADVWFMDQAALEKCLAMVVELEDTKKYSTQDQINQLEILGFENVYSYGRVFFFSKYNVA